MPTAQVELDDRHEALDWVVDVWHWKKSFRVRHEAALSISDPAPLKCMPLGTYFVIRSSIDRGSRMKVGSVTLLKSAPGRSCEMICDKTTESVCEAWWAWGRYSVSPLPWSGSTTADN